MSVANPLTVVGTPNQTPDPASGGRRVMFMRDNLLKYPEMWLSVYVAGSDTEQRQFAEMFVRASCYRADSPEAADLVIFTGGLDVDPSLYGEKPHSKTRIDEKRDEADISLYWKCWTDGTPMLGICRGAQFLHVMQGGKLFQDVDGHYGDHSIYDVKSKQEISKTSSVHHQMVVDNSENGMDVIAFNVGLSQRRHLSPTLVETGTQKDIEAFFYRDACVLGFQGHPEYRGYGEYTKWCLDTIHRYMNENPDLKYENKVLRIKSEILEQRKQLLGVVN